MLKFPVLHLRMRARDSRFLGKSAGKAGAFSHVGRPLHCVCVCDAKLFGKKVAGVTPVIYDNDRRGKDSSVSLLSCKYLAIESA